ncbi:DEAD/DEAH box helicase [Clostridium uliginosum]|uniref:ATP-dependent RNA helicase DbpA n=1 Tax=Clostridium uliginosum TaxID=119641 RepID=A0A1I1SA87_9CLOT|nr:DEAD/DEAH box helicase [Clostridium uliginosum]SFD41538.1 Superfamily II DNA and RNA helicase [Clostridium uliginosum]
MSKEFNKFGISDEILKAIESLGYEKPSEVQEKVIPEILMNKDLVVKSQTGSGKTAAFGIPLCEKIDWEENKPQVLVLTPTRELAVQVSEDISNIGRFKRINAVAVFGKQPITQQERKLKQKTHIVVGTPGRILDHLDRGSLDVSKLNYLVIDEADEMLNMGFIKEVEGIIRKLPKRKITLLFSATMPDEIKSLCNKHMNNPTSISIESQKLITDKIDQYIYHVEYDKKLDVLNNLLICEMPETGMIFCRTQENVDMIFDYLENKGYSTNKIHGGMLQKDRLRTMEDFRRGDFRILVATDVASRGIDIEGITHVINFDLPVEKEAYVHRIGRTGRAGAKGKALTLCKNGGDKFLNDIQELIGFKIQVKAVPNKDEVSNNLDQGLQLLKTKPKRKTEKAKIINKDITKIYLNGGKKKKIRPGDIVGAVTKIEGVTGDDIGIIDVQDTVSYIDILNGKGNAVIEALKTATIKGKQLKCSKAYSKK